MRPTVSEQLAGIRRVLAEVIGPEVTGAYAVDMLRGVLANLEMLERSWTNIGPFLAWDNDGTEAVLERIAPLVDADLAARIGDALVAAPADPTDVNELDARNTALRQLVADAVPVLAAGADRSAEVYAEVRAHLSRRIERFPLSMNAPMPGAAR
jgi:hypothetical protein